MRLVLEAGFDRVSGYGNDAVDLAIFLSRAGVEVTPMPLSLLPGLPREFTRLLERDPYQGPKDVLVRFAPPHLLGRPSVAGKVPCVGYTMWERTPVRERDLSADGLGWWDALLVTCPMNVEAFRPVFDGPIEVAPCGVASDDWPSRPRSGGGPVRFLMVGMLNGRKDPFVMLDVWRELKESVPGFDAELTLHTLAPGLHPKIAEVYPDVTISDKQLDREGLLGLYYDHDVLVSTSRGEGNNKPAMEFMASGGPVIASDWSGHQNWLWPDAAWPVAGSLVPSRQAEDCQEFAVDRGALGAAVLEAWSDGGLRREKGRQAARLVRSALSWESAVSTLVSKVARLL